MKPLHDAHIHARRAYVLEWLRARTLEDGGCMLWTGGMSSRGLVPVASFRSVRGTNVRRLAYWAIHGSLPAGLDIVPTCGNRRCMSCLKPMTVSQRNKLAVQRGTYNNPTKLARSAMASRARAKLTREDVERVRSMRADGAQYAEIAAVFGVREQHIGRIVRGQFWNDDIATSASVFTWRPAA